MATTTTTSVDFNDSELVLVRRTTGTEVRCVGDCSCVGDNNTLSDLGTVAKGGGTLPDPADVLGAELGDPEVVVCLPVWEERDVVGTELMGEVMWVVVTGCFIALLRSSNSVLRVLRTLAAALPLGDPTEITAAAAGRDRRAVLRDGDVAVVVVPFPVGEDAVPDTFRSPLATLFSEDIGEPDEAAGWDDGAVVVAAPARLVDGLVVLTAPGGSSRRSLEVGAAAGGREAADPPGGDAAPLEELTLLVINAVLDASVVADDELATGWAPYEIPDILPSAATPPPPPKVALLRRFNIATTTSSGNWQSSLVGTQSTSLLRAYRGSNAAVIL